MLRTMSAACAVALVTGALVSPAAGSDKADILATMHQFVDGLNKGDTKTALAACAAPAFIIDEFPPHAWQGATACADWATDFEAYNKKYGIAEPIAKLGKPIHVDITGDRAYVVTPATYTYKQKGRHVSEIGSILTVALQRSAEGWRMTGWAWSKR